MENLDKIKVREQTNIEELKVTAFNNAISQEYEKWFQDVMLSLKEEGRTHLAVTDIRKMNEVSIIINGVRYDAVEKPEYKKGIDVCNGCDICELYEVEGIMFPCSKIIGSKRVFKKSTKSFER